MHLLIEGWLRRGSTDCTLLPPHFRSGKLRVEASGLGVHVQGMDFGTIVAANNSS